MPRTSLNGCGWHLTRTGADLSACCRGSLLRGEHLLERLRHRDDLTVGEMAREVRLDARQVDGSDRGQPVPALGGDLRVGRPLVVWVG